MTLQIVSSLDDLSGKQGKLKKNEYGHYEIMVGAYNIPNSVDEIYPYEEEQRLLLDSRAGKSVASKRCLKSQLYSECDHPSLDEFKAHGLNDDKAVALWLKRLVDIKTSNMAGQIHDFKSIPLNQKCGNRDVYGVLAYVSPKVEQLERSLEDPTSNTAFSVRSFVRRVSIRGQVYCKQNEIITWDWVPNPGIALATKYNTPSLESETIQIPKKVVLESGTVSRQVIEYLDEMRFNSSALESEGFVTTQLVKNLYGQYQEVMNLDHIASRRWGRE